MLFLLSKTKRLEIYFSMLYLQNLLSFPLKCHPIHPGTHKDPSIGALNKSQELKVFHGCQKLTSAKN